LEEFNKGLNDINYLNTLATNSIELFGQISS